MPGRRDAPVSLSIILSMPAGTDPGRVHDAARSFASTLFADRHPYVFALHTDEPHPHVHLTVRAMGRDGERLNPRKADLQLWRETFAAALRDRGVEAEADPAPGARHHSQVGEDACAEAARPFRTGRGADAGHAEGGAEGGGGTARRGPALGGASETAAGGNPAVARRRGSSASGLDDGEGPTTGRGSGSVRPTSAASCNASGDSGARAHDRPGRGASSQGARTLARRQPKSVGSAFSHHADVQFRRECQVRKATRCGHS